MTHNPHFANVDTWQAARTMLSFRPLDPSQNQMISTAAVRRSLPGATKTSNT